MIFNVGYKIGPWAYTPKPGKVEADTLEQAKVLAKALYEQNPSKMPLTEDYADPKDILIMITGMTANMEFLAGTFDFETLTKLR